MDVTTAESTIPTSLYNELAWIIGESDEVILHSFVKVDQTVHLKLLSLLQDAITYTLNQKS